jgi:hypothetical protein
MRPARTRQTTAGWPRAGGSSGLSRFSVRGRNASSGLAVSAGSGFESGDAQGPVFLPLILERAGVRVVTDSSSRAAYRRHQARDELAPSSAQRPCAAWCPHSAPPAGLYVLQKSGSRADVQDMTPNDEPIYETVMREHNWDPERCKPLILTTPSVGRHIA